WGLPSELPSVLLSNLTWKLFQPGLVPAPLTSIGTSHTSSYGLGSYRVCLGPVWVRPEQALCARASQCPDRVWLPPILVLQRRRAESLGHLLLEIVCQDRPRTLCALCTRLHVEKFLLIGNIFTVWNMIIKPVLKRVATA
ncbi:hypothetical protein GG344DRAFT_71522, partial [Lentinula edodes]